MYILGINAYHGDSSACIFQDGKLLVATEEERFRRIKHWAGFPSESIRFCLKEAGISIQHVDAICISRDPKANLVKKFFFSLSHLSALKNVNSRIKNSGKILGIKKMLAQELQIEEKKIIAKVINVEHHRSHLASAFFASPFEESAVLSIDGFGDFSSTMTAIGKGNKISVLESVNYPHSIGLFYTAFTQYLGFPNYGDEYKVMGLAPYGKPSLVEKVRKVIYPKGNLFELNLDYFNHLENGIKMNWENGIPEIKSVFSKKFIDTFGTPRKINDPLSDYHKDLATSVQRVCEEIIFHILNKLHAKTKSNNICIAGGVAQNSVANGKITQATAFKSLYIPCAGHDAGTCIGAGLYFYNQILEMPRLDAMKSAYLGYKSSEKEILSLLSETPGISFKKITTEKELIDNVSNQLIAGNVVGWYQGRAEFGPRALGHRSILVDPRRKDAKELLNEKIKRRESFRPFAPSILKECVADFFEIVDEVPFMEKVFPIRKEKQDLIPAVTHVDGTGRLQTVEEGDRYYSLIKSFGEKTGVPILLNTSFNENEPIVNLPHEALDCFLRTKMDVLVLDNFIIERKSETNLK